MLRVRDGPTDVAAASRTNHYFRFRQSIFLFVQFRSHLC
jgi:hypothetical protein